MLRSIVEIKKLPQKVSQKEEVIFFRELEKCMHMDRPRIVLDCSGILRADYAVMDLLLCCLEAALKRNGDVKLAAVTPNLSEVLHANGMIRLFDMYSTIGDAVDSFNQNSIEAILETLIPSRNTLLETESAA
jgi:anti-anti-sigma regulatory factor